MKFILLSSDANPKSYYWQLNAGGEPLFKSEVFDSFIGALRSIEAFHLGLSSLPVFDQDGQRVAPVKSKPEFPPSLFVHLAQDEDSSWRWELCTRDGIPLTSLGPYETRDQAIGYARSYVQDLYSEAAVTDENGVMPPVISFTRRYRETFGIFDTHPSASSNY